MGKKTEKEEKTKPTISSVIASATSKRANEEKPPKSDKKKEEGASSSADLNEDFLVIGQSLSAKQKQLLHEDINAFEERSFFKSRSRDLEGDDSMEVLGISTDTADQDDMFELFSFDDLVGDLTESI
mmetsp:Transcript_12/g.49  ORF Transcript_12/g.49 Transcript_12/m.49 type:complete len:127 (+) Transcript_12:918-1298(+)